MSCHRDCLWAHPPGHTWPPAGTSVNPELEIPSFKWKCGLALKLTRSLTKLVYIVHDVQISYNSYLHNILELVSVQKAQRTRHAPRQRGCWGTLWGNTQLLSSPRELCPLNNHKSNWERRHRRHRGSSGHSRSEQPPPFLTPEGQLARRVGMSTACSPGAGRVLSECPLCPETLCIWRQIDLFLFVCLLNNQHVVIGSALGTLLVTVINKGRRSLFLGN